MGIILRIIAEFLLYIAAELAASALVEGIKAVIPANMRGFFSNCCLAVVFLAFMVILCGGVALLLSIS